MDVEACLSSTNVKHLELIEMMFNGSCSEFHSQDPSHLLKASFRTLELWSKFLLYASNIHHRSLLQADWIEDISGMLPHQSLWDDQLSNTVGTGFMPHWSISFGAQDIQLISSAVHPELLTYQRPPSWILRHSSLSLLQAVLDHLAAYYWYLK